MTDSNDNTVMNHKFCQKCRGTGKLMVDGDSVNEKFEVEKQTVMTPCPQCGGKGFFTDSYRQPAKI